MNESLAKIESQPVALRDDPLSQVGMMLQTTLDKGITTENTEALGKMLELFQKMQDKKAEQDFNAAFNALQAEMPNITAKKPVQGGKAGEQKYVKYAYAPYEDIMDQVRPLLIKHGFTISFSQKYDGPRIIQICTLRHTSGHSSQNEFAVRIGGGPPGATESQSDGSASTYAKRFALCNCLNIIIEQDDDRRNEGAFITAAQAASLKKRVLETGSDMVKFLKFAGAKEFEEIGSVRYAELDAELRKRESTR
jgi:hypothetical protein